MRDHILLAELDSGSGELILLVAVIEVSQKRYSIDKFRTQLSSGTNEAEKAIKNCWKQIRFRYSDVWFFPIAVVGGKIPNREFIETQKNQFSSVQRNFAEAKSFVLVVARTGLRTLAKSRRCYPRRGA